MSNFETEIEDHNGDRFHHLFAENLVSAEIAKVQGASEARFSKSKKLIENHFFKVGLIRCKTNFDLNELHLSFSKNFGNRKL